MAAMFAAGTLALAVSWVSLDRVAVGKEHLAFQIGCGTGQAGVALGYFSSPGGGSAGMS